MKGFNFEKYAKRIEAASPTSKYDPDFKLGYPPPWFMRGTGDLSKSELDAGINRYLESLMYGQKTAPNVTFGLAVEKDYRTGIPFVQIFAIERNEK